MRDVGKEFEKRLKSDWESSVEDSWIYRLVDVTSGYYGIRNVSDFIAYKNPYMIVIEAKSIKGNTFSVNFRQREDLSELREQNVSGMKIGVILFFRDHHKVVWVPIDTFDKLIKDGKKSFNVKMLEDTEYEHFIIESKTLRTFERCNFSSLINYFKENMDASN